MECESYVSKNDVQNNELNNNKTIVGSNPELIITDVTIAEPVLSKKKVMLAFKRVLSKNS